MGLYISGLEMPKNGSCIQIVIDDDGKVYPSVEKCILKMSSIAKAVPIPPHGDLIDRDALRDNNCDAFEINGADGTILAMDVSIIDDAPIIIPADPADEGE